MDAAAVPTTPPIRSRDSAGARDRAVATAATAAAEKGSSRDATVFGNFVSSGTAARSLDVQGSPAATRVTCLRRSERPGPGWVERTRAALEAPNAEESFRQVPGEPPAFEESTVP